MKLLQLNTLTKEFVNDLKSSFDDLPETSHKDGKYRLRRYSVVELRTTFWSAVTQIEITHLPTRSFKQSKKLNDHQGGMSRLFDEIDEDTLQSKGMKEACHAFMPHCPPPPPMCISIGICKISVQQICFVFWTQDLKIFN